MYKTTNTNATTTITMATTNTTTAQPQRLHTTTINTSIFNRIHNANSSNHTATPPATTRQQNRSIATTNKTQTRATTATLQQFTSLNTSIFNRIHNANSNNNNNDDDDGSNCNNHEKTLTNLNVHRLFGNNNLKSYTMDVSNNHTVEQKQCPQNTSPLCLCSKTMSVSIVASAENQYAGVCVCACVWLTCGKSNQKRTILLWHQI